MAGGLSATEGALKAGASTMSSCRVALSDELQALKGKLADLPSAWTGEGATAFASCVENWLAGAAKTINVLDKFESDLLASDRSYATTDDEQKAAMDKLASLLGSVPKSVAC
jgi:WXG100 family type VII secretion target